MVSLSTGFVAFIVGTALTLFVPVLCFWLIYKILQGIGFVIGGGFRLARRGIGALARFVRDELVDALQLAGCIVTSAVILPLSLTNALIGRLSAARHYGRALEDELISALVSVYRIALGHPTRLLGLAPLLDGVERRLPDLIARAPRTGAVPSRRASSAAGQPGFAGYKVLRELRAGGSGARLFLAQPNPSKSRELAERGHTAVGDVVIKSFDRRFGSTLPQIVRESRALEAAKRLGHVLEHQLDEERFHYVMPFVPGDDLDVVTRRLHAAAGERGLDRRALAKVLGYTSDLCTTLTRFHREGLWHKDIKPTNLLVSNDRLQVVDLGLVTPLASALTLTTHGTEYFRDPELVRLAVRGAKVHEVDGVKFDVYSAGAVLFSMLENNFPAHGSLSRLTRPVPEALAFIVRRAMSEVNQRYASAEAMGRDVATLLAAADPFSVRPAELPSFRELNELEAARDLAHTGADAASGPSLAPLAPMAPKARLARHTSADAAPATASSAKQVRRRHTVRAYGLVAMFLCSLLGGLVLVKHRREAATSDARWANSVVETNWSPTRPILEGTVIAGANTVQTRATRAESQRAQGRSVGRVLIYADPRLARSENIQPYVQSVQDSGFEAIGLGNTRSEIHLLASVQHLVSDAALGDVEVLERLSRWLDQDVNHLRAILWLAPGSCAGSVASQLVERPSISAVAAPTTTVGVAHTAK